MQRTVLAGVVDRVLESTWLAALVAVPALMNLYSERIFEGDKVPFLWALALFAAALGVVRGIEGAGVNLSVRSPLVAAAIGVVVVTGLANSFSIAPAISFWGSYERLQGTATLLAYATLFFVFVAFAGRPQVERLVTAALIASLVPSLYALIYVLGVDPVQWGPAVVGRVHSTAGNPIFFGAFLILVIPLSLARLLAAIDAGRRAAAVVYVALLLLQTVALALTQSRGPILALAVGLTVFVAADLARGNFRRAVRAAGVIAMTALVAVLCVRALTVPREDDVTELVAGNARVRLLIWQGTLQLIASQPTRLALGYGPDTFRFVFPPFSPAALGPLEEADVTADRAHNDVLDTLVSSGLCGLSMRICFIAALFALLIRGLMRSTRTHGDGDLLALGLLAAVVAHVAEIQLSIATATTQLYLWMLAAAAAVLFATDPSPEVSQDGDTDIVLGFAIAQLLAVIVFGLYTPGTTAQEIQPGLVLLLGGTWLAGLALLLASSPRTPPRRIGVARFALASIGGGLAFALPYALWIRTTPTHAGLLLANDYITHFISVFYVGVFVLIVCGGIAPVLLNTRLSPRFSSRPWMQLAVAPLLVIATVWGVTRASVATARADAYAKLGLRYEEKRQFDLAARIYERALQLQPRESRYALLRARALSAASGPGASRDGADAVERAALAAWQINSLEADNAALVARVDRRLSVTAADSARRNNADVFYRRALDLSPRRSTLWNEYAGFLLEIGEPTRALAALDQALRLDDASAASYLLRAHACLRLERYADALEAADSALVLDPKLVPAWTIKAFALTHLDQPFAAILANRQALALAPHDLIVHRNLAALYRDEGMFDEALEHAHAALEVAQGEERPPLEELIRQLEAPRANAAARQ